MKIELSKIQEILPEILGNRHAYFLEKIMAHVTGAPFKIEKTEVKELFVNELVQELMMGLRFQEIFSVVPMNEMEPQEEMHLLLIDDEVLILIMYDFLSLTVSAGYSDNGPLNEPESISKIRKILAQYKAQVTNKGKVNLMCMLHNELSTKQFKLPKTELDLASHYNEGILNFHGKVLTALNGKKENGIVFLHGKPGTGKTTYIRYLISQLDRKVIFVPSDLVSQLGRPEFMQFMLMNKNSVIIIEDAESVLEDRTAVRNSVVSNLLNLSDGILSDALKIQFICTFNTDIKRIDSAFLRGGRMIAIHEFKALEVDLANALARTLGGSREFAKPTTLADIYNDIGDELRIKNEEIGFKRD